MGIISADELAASLDDITVVDLRWRPGKPGHDAWSRARIPGSVHVDLDTVLSDRSDLSKGRHALPDPQICADALAAHGIGDRPVVAVDDLKGAIAARLWWTLGWLGGPPCRVLDGGLEAWIAAGHSLSTTPPPPPVPATPWTPRVDPTRVATLPEIRAGVPVLLDARSAERFAGRNEHLDPAAGHVPGATSAPWTANLTGDRFSDATTLARRFADLGVTDPEAVVCMCGSGVTACHNLLAMELAGLPGARLWVGSFSQWSRQGLPVET